MLLPLQGRIIHTFFLGEGLRPHLFPLAGGKHLSEIILHLGDFSSVEVICHVEDDVMEFQIVKEELWDGIISDCCTEDVSRHSTSAVAVTAMVYRCYHGLLETGEMM